jgi:BirA family biotin operon repressor/biotin-[acetyl-CoA-carboxylase] ligase
LGIHSNTLFIGKVCTYLDQTPSTQLYLQDLCAKTEPIDGTAILSYHQTAGKGQGLNIWHSTPGRNIALSILLRPDFLTLQNQYLLNMAIALAVRDLIADLTRQEVRIKWPNDILVNGRKIAGILINNTLQGHRWKNAVIGIGINVNEAAFPVKLPHATSLSLVMQHEFELDAVVSLLFEKLEQRYLSLKGKAFTQVLNEFNQSLFRINEEIIISDHDTIYSATLIGVGIDGRIITSTPAGVNRAFRHKEVAIDFRLGIN